MNLSIPIYIERQGEQLSFCPLFAPENKMRHRNMERGMASLSAKLRRVLNELNRQNRHDELARYSFQPEFEDRMLDFRIIADKKSVRVRLLFVLIRHSDRRIVHAPALPGLWFDLMRGEDLETRAREAMSAYVRDLLKDEPEDGEAFDPETDLNKKAWIMHLDIEFRPKLIAKTVDDTSPFPFAAIGGGEKMEGRWELENTGRCLNELYPDGLGHAFLRERELRELENAITDGRRRPLLLIGPSQVGKTAICHQYLRRAIERQKEGRFKKPSRFWLLSPQRLISGMSYVGQWEERVLSILKHVSGKRIVLVFDDFLGLYQAGVTSGSDLSVAHVLKPFAARGEVAVLAEMTPDAFRILQEWDRGFADLFHVIPVRETTPEETLAILTRSMRELEGRYECRFHPGVLTLAIDLQRRYARNYAFPGKAVRFLDQLASRFEKAEIAPGEALDEFHKTSGLTLAILDDRVRLLKSEVEVSLRRTVVGQEDAVTAMAEAVSIAKARLNDPTRPLASFLFLGPTGVGKTQSAKALAASLFGTEDRLIRFDMNEYVEADAVARLVGTFYQPQGLLTNAVRHTPFAVILLDEIEKAHSDVFNLLLQVLDDGRLTDALGRTADFTNAIIIMTSNLGSRGTGKSIGYTKSGKNAEAARYVKAAEQFFRPEFFNRLDRIIPFAHLSKPEIELICGKIMDAIFRREGLVRRRCLLDIHPDIIAKAAEDGYHPEMGARALKRAVERSIARPVAAHLAGLNPGKAAVISIAKDDSHATQNRFYVRATELGEARKENRPLLSMNEDEALERMGRMDEFIKRVSDMLAELRPDYGINTDNVLPEHEFYFEASEHLTWLRRKFERFADFRIENTRFVRPPYGDMKFRRRKKRRKFWKNHEIHTSQKELLAIQQLGEYLETAEASGKTISADQSEPVRLLFDAAWLNALINAGPDRFGQTALVRVRVYGDSNIRGHLSDMLASTGEKPFSWALLKTDGGMALEGTLTYDLLKSEQGGHLFSGRHGGFSLADVSVTNESETNSAQSFEKRDAYPEVIRIYDENKTVFDIRSGLVLKSVCPSAEEFHTLLVGRLPLPPELE